MNLEKVESEPVVPPPTFTLSDLTEFDKETIRCALFSLAEGDGNASRAMRKRAQELHQQIWTFETNRPYTYYDINYDNED